jgi:hypothetical protein
MYTEWKAQAPYDTVLCGLSGCTILFQIITQTTLFSGGGGGEVIEDKMCVLILSLQIYIKLFSL